jgi:hypothetical protein
MSTYFSNGIKILIDGQNQPVQDNLVGLHINFVDTQNESSNQKTITVVNEQQQTSMFKGNYLIIQFHFYSDHYKIFATKELDISKGTDELYSGTGSKVSIVGSRQTSNILISMTSKQEPSAAADWIKHELSGSQIDIELEPDRYYEIP